MSTEPAPVSSPDASLPVPDAPSGARRSLRIAWICVALIPVAAVAAMFLGEGLFSVLGGDAGEESAGTVLAAGLPATLLGLVPGVLALVFGLRARKQGDGRGSVPAVLGGLIVLYWVVTPLLSLLAATVITG